MEYLTQGWANFSFLGQHGTSLSLNGPHSTPKKLNLLTLNDKMFSSKQVLSKQNKNCRIQLLVVVFGHKLNPNREKNDSSAVHISVVKLEVMGLFTETSYDNFKIRFMIS